MTAAEAVVRAGLGSRYTAAVLRVERAGSLVFERAYGTLDAAPGAAIATGRTAFDLASLTKVAVATAALEAIGDGALALDVPLAAGPLPEWAGGEKAGITARMLLAHAGGLASGADYRMLRAERVDRYALERPLISAPGTETLYSDLGFIALGVALARARGTGLRSALGRTLARLGLGATGYRTRDDGAAAIPATEADPWRGRVRGRVHDEKAYLMGGIAGHAGLFGTARDVALLAAPYLRAARGGDAAPLPPALARAAIVEQAPDPVLRRGLGWALRTGEANSCGRRMSPTTFGHAGFTGTCVWADPERELTIVLLANGVYFGRRDLRDVRAAVCDAVVAAMDVA